MVYMFFFFFNMSLPRGHRFLSTLIFLGLLGVHICAQVFSSYTETWVQQASSFVAYLDPNLSCILVIYFRQAGGIASRSKGNVGRG